jgi:hypothetical protein
VEWKQQGWSVDVKYNGGVSIINSIPTTYQLAASHQLETLQTQMNVQLNVGGIKCHVSPHAITVVIVFCMMF